MVRKEKIKIVKKLKQKMENNKVISILDMHGMPSKQLQEMRKDLKGRAEIIMSKKTLIKRAMDNADVNNIEKLKEKLKGVPALLFTNESPFRLYQYLKKNKSPAKAKVGDKAPKNIEVEPGPTDLAPGPAISQLQSAGLQTSVGGGKIKIVKGATVLKEGEEVTEDLASLFNMLGLEPMKVGLTMRCAFEDGVIYDEGILNVDLNEYRKNIEQGVQQSINLSVNAGYYTSSNITIAVNSAVNQAKNLALEASVITKNNIDIILARAVQEAKALEQQINLE